MRNIAKLLRRSLVMERKYDFTLFNQKKDLPAVRFVTAAQVNIQYAILIFEKQYKIIESKDL